MKRLLNRIAREQLELFHTTSSQILKKIKETGALQPSSETGITSNGLESINLPPEKRTPSGNQNGIYLGEESVLSYYREKATSGTFFDKSIPNISTDLKINVDTDNLLPDYDDMVVLLEDPNDTEELNSLFEEGVPQWKTSLDEIGQVVHSGTINVDSITGVRFVSEDIIHSDSGESLDIIKDAIEFNTWLDLDTAINQLEKLEINIKNLEPQVASSRLRRVKRG